MNSKFSKCLLAVFFALSAGVPAFAQIGIFQGVVTDANGQPIQGATVTIEGMEIKRSYKLTTDKKGKYIHAGIPLQGTYRIVVKKDGYASEGTSGVKPGFGMDDPRGTQNFKMSPGQSGKAAVEMTDEEKAAIQKASKENEEKREVLAKLQGVFEQGRQLATQGQHEQAIEQFKQAAQIDATQPAVWANMGSSYNQLKQYDLAIESYNKAIELKPTDPGLFQNLAGVYGAQGNVEKSKEMYEKAAGLAAATDPKTAAVQYYNMGVTYINTGKSAEAEEALNKSLQMDPNYAEAHYQLGLTQLGLNKMDDALTHLKKYVELAPTGDNAEVAKQLIEQLSKK